MLICSGEVVGVVWFLGGEGWGGGGGGGGGGGS